MLWEKGDIILRNHHNNGFTLIEVLVACSVIFMLISVVIPIVETIKLERIKHYDKRNIAFSLHNELLSKLYDDYYDESVKTEFIHQLNVTYSFERDGNLIEGCAHWKNVKKKDETLCYFGHIESG